MQGGGDDAAKVSSAVNEALSCGYRHIDCAQYYGNEPEIGAVLAPFLASNPRESLFVTSKVWNTNHHPDHVEPSVRKSVVDLQCDYLDLLLIHWPVAWRHTGLDFKDGGGSPMDSEGKLQWQSVAIIDTWRAMEALVDGGLVRSIGVSNFPIILLQDLVVQARIQPAVNQVECHPYLSQPAFVTYHQERGIHVSAYSPLGRPGRTKQESVIYDSTVQQQATHLSSLLTDSATAFSPATVLLAFNILRGLSVLPKSSTPERVAHNYTSVLWLLEALNDGEKGGDGKVRAAFMEAVSGLNRNLRYCNAIIAGEKQGKFERQGPTLFE